jgi:Mg-chelatase subunit ChlD
VRADACRAIGNVGTPQALDAMYRAIFGKSGRSARFALLYSVLPESLARLRSDEDWKWVRKSILLPSRSGTPTGLVHLAAYHARAMLIVTLRGAGLAGRRELEDDVRPFARHEDPEIRAEAVRALGRMGVAAGLIQSSLNDPHEWVRMAAARGESLPMIQVQRALGDASVPVRRMALRNLAERGWETGVPGLIGRLGAEPSDLARLDAVLLLEAATGEEFGRDPVLWRDWWRAQGGRRGPGEPKRKGTRTTARRALQANRILFLVDLSASMNGIGVDGRSRQQHALEVMRGFIAAAPSEAKYAVIAFASELRRLPARGGAGTRAGTILPWVESLQPAGASNSYAALMSGIQDPIRPDTIVFLSDGVPRHCSWRGRTYSQPEQILHEVRAANRTALVRIHAVALLGGIPRGDEKLDQESAVGFLRRLAAENEGTYREVR